MARSPKNIAGQPVSASDAADRKVAAEAYKKTLAGQEITDRERRALKRVEKDQEEKRRWQYYATISQKHWKAMSGRQAKVLAEQAALYGIPFGGATINLPDVVRGLHDFLAENAHKLAREDDSLLSGPASPALERYREERAAMARLDRLEREGRLVDRRRMLDGLARAAAVIRGAGDALQREFGPAALALLLEALDEAEREVARISAQFSGTDQEQAVERGT